MLILINPKAGGGTALQKWNRMERDLPRDREIAVEVVDDPSGVPERVERGIADGHRTFLAGGGDGTVNVLANALVGSFAPGRILGAIGLGSSNDFHKPVRTRLGGVPCRMDAKHTAFQDVGRLVLTDARGRTTVRHWLVNASIGLTADANRRFNAKRGFLGRMKGVSTGAAITTAALASVLRDRGRDLQVAVDGWPLGTGRFRNLAFVKNPTFAGCLSYGRERVPPAGSFGFHAVDDVSLAVLLRILAGLARGRFPRRRSTHSRNAITAEVWGGEPFAVEFDGEVTEAVSVLVSLVPRRLEVCA